MWRRREQCHRCTPQNTDCGTGQLAHFLQQIHCRKRIEEKTLDKMTLKRHSNGLQYYSYPDFKKPQNII